MGAPLDARGLIDGDPSDPNILDVAVGVANRVLVAVTILPGN